MEAVAERLMDVPMLKYLVRTSQVGMGPVTGSQNWSVLDIRQSLF
jgi:hypothetical protein